MPEALAAVSASHVMQARVVRPKNCTTDCMDAKTPLPPKKESNTVRTVLPPAPPENKFWLRAGAGLMLSPGFSAAVGYSKKKNLLWEGVVEWASLPEWKSVYTIDRRRMGLALYTPFSSSFLPSAGLFYERIKILTTGGRTAIVNGATFKYKDDQFTSTHQQIQLQVGVGNRWEWGPVFFGTEWLGVSLPLLTLSEAYSKDSEFPDSLFASATSVAKFTAQVWSVRIFNATAGVSF